MIDDPPWRRLWAWLIGSLLGCSLTGVWLHPVVFFSLRIGTALLVYALTPDPVPTADS